jgi:hypothetical protein
MQHRDSSAWARALASALSLAVLAACGGGGGEPGKQANEQPNDQVTLGLPNEKAVYDTVTPEIRKKALGLPPASSIPADANLRGMFGPVQAFPLIPVHAVLLPDGRMLSYGTDTTGKQTANFNYAVWDPSDDSHQTLPNNTATDIFCSSQLVLPAGDKVFIAGGDNWTGTATTNTGNNNSNLFNVADRTLTRQTNMNRARWYSSSITLLNGETYIQGGSSGGDRPEVRATDGSFRLLSNTNTSGLDVTFPRNSWRPTAVCSALTAPAACTT